jgi:hypothetical protein
MEDLSELLNSATGDQRRRKTFYEIDTEFEKLTASLLKNFDSMAFLRASLQTAAGHAKGPSVSELLGQQALCLRIAQIIIVLLLFLQKQNHLHTRCPLLERVAPPVREVVWPTREEWDGVF